MSLGEYWCGKASVRDGTGSRNEKNVGRPKHVTEEAPVPGVVRMVGRYEIVRQIGRGGMASCYLARQSTSTARSRSRSCDAFHAATRRSRSASCASRAWRAR